ncbi:MAG: hypothetical protein KDA22_07250, partial [Phycisphaerales bacterium]|nr:hypothetical protein [Phycisphaerales bacterium]
DALRRLQAQLSDDRPSRFYRNGGHNGHNGSAAPPARNGRAAENGHHGSNGHLDPRSMNGTSRRQKPRAQAG